MTRQRPLLTTQRRLIAEELARPKPQHCLICSVALEPVSRTDDYEDGVGFPVPTRATTSLPSTPTTAARPASCQSRALSILLLSRARAAAGTAYYPIEFQNISATPCTLYGFPRVSFTDKNYSTQVGPAATSRKNCRAAAAFARRRIR